MKMLRCNNLLTRELNRYGRTDGRWQCKCKELLNASIKGTNTHMWDCISAVTWVYTNTHTRELKRYRPDDDDGRHTLNPFYLLLTEFILFPVLSMEGAATQACGSFMGAQPWNNWRGYVIGMNTLLAWIRKLRCVNYEVTPKWRIHAEKLWNRFCT